MVSQVRRFNRVVTQNMGVLNDHFLARGRPIGEARVLWEIGSKERDVRSLRAELGLDSGYLSRLLRSLEGAGLITVEPLDADRRVRVARLTRTGAAERRVLDHRADHLATSLLERLEPGQRARLVAAMADVEQLLTAAAVAIAPIDPAHRHAQYCLRSYFTELNRRFHTGFDPTKSIPAHNADLRPPAGLLLVATLGSDPVGCGALKFHADSPAELKRMWVAESVRGLGIGRRLLAELEKRAIEHGVRTLRLETNGTLTEAISLYRSMGYIEVQPFNDEPYAQHWFEKRMANVASR